MAYHATQPSSQLIRRALAGEIMDRTTSMGLWTYSYRFFKASQELVKSGNVELMSPSYYLIAHALELSLKGFLRGKGCTLDDLKSYRKFGHDLNKCLNGALEQGLEEFIQLTEEENAAVQLINEYYKEKDLEYIKTGFKTYPEIEILLALEERLLFRIRTFCFETMDLHRETSV